ncbi:MAG: MerR family DNA-binding transcriptional regulator [Burkholderiales bacterium]|nr:MerR family DNA-binding transcriptional regulator [Burkholderiales bacterium]
MTAETYTITELAQEFGITTRTIRFYEDHGLLRPGREGRNRVYDKRDRVRLKLTLRGKRLGLSLTEIRELLDIYDAAHDEGAQLSQFLVALRLRREALEQQREDIDATIDEIQAFEAQCRQLLERQEARKPSARSGRTRATTAPRAPAKPRKLTLT